MTPLQTSQEITALLPTDIIPHIPSSPQTQPPLHPTYRNVVLRKHANALLPSHLKYMTHKNPSEYLSPFWNTSICLPHPWGPVWCLFVYGENIALQLPVSIPGFSDAHRSLCKICGVKLSLCPDRAGDSDEIYSQQQHYMLCLNWPFSEPLCWKAAVQS